MDIPLLFLLPDHLRHKIMFVCPGCGSQTFTPTTTDLAHLRCVHCGIVHNAENAEFEILARPDPQEGKPPGHKPGEPPTTLW